MQTPEAPCSSMARAQERPRVPAPPVTGRCWLVWVCSCLDVWMDERPFSDVSGLSHLAIHLVASKQNISDIFLAVSQLQRQPSDVVFQGDVLSRTNLPLFQACRCGREMVSNVGSLTNNIALDGKPRDSPTLSVQVVR